MIPTPVTRETLPDLDKPQGHKYDHGHAVILSGEPGQGGAARLAARAALRVGAGLVTVAAPQRAMFEHSAQLNAIMVRGIDGPAGFEDLLEDVRVTALCLGPGLGLKKVTVDLVRVALQSRLSVVLDADALSRFERTPDALFEQLHPKAVLTPHAGEFRRLFPDLEVAIDFDADLNDRADQVAAAAARAGCAVLLKGVDTLVADHEGRVFHHAATGARATPWLATAGAGDVLSGLITGLMARGQSPVIAATTAAWLHVSAARLVGPGLIAEDLSEAMPQVLSALIDG